MRLQENTGWRKPVPGALMHALPIDEATKEDLFEAARAAGQALSLKSGARQLLDRLIGCYGGEPISGQLLVWPSNARLEELTGLCERSVRYLVRFLTEIGLIVPKDHATGKRFARRSASGQIIDAFGFDLSPLLTRKSEFLDRVAEIRAESSRRRQVFDEITICRRQVQEIILALIEWETPTEALQRAFEVECSQTPRRESRASPDASLTRWRALRISAEEQYLSVTAGKNCRHKEDNNDSPDQSCNKEPRENAGATARISLIDLAAACPDAFGYAERIETERDLVGVAARLRGAFGAHESAWHEACEKLGLVPAAAAFFVVLQLYDEDQHSAQRIKNPGGYFRAYIRRIADGSINLMEEIRYMRRKRSH